MIPISIRVDAGLHDRLRRCSASADLGEALFEKIHAESRSKAGPSKPRRKRAAFRPAPEIFDGAAVFALTCHGASDPARDEPSPAAPSSEILAPARGRRRIEIDFYDHENGQARRARPA